MLLSRRTGICGISDGGSWHSSQESAKDLWQQCCQADPLFSPQQWVELASPAQGHQFVAAADVPAVDEDLRHCPLPAGPADRLLALGRAVWCVDLPESHTL